MGVHSEPPPLMTGTSSLGAGGAVSGEDVVIFPWT